jgi:hypothetical protein
VWCAKTFSILASEEIQKTYKHHENGGSRHMQSGTKVVLGIFGLAIVAAALSWWYRFETAHESTKFWGPHFALLIVEPSEVTAFALKKANDETEGSFPILSDRYLRTDTRKLSDARGMIHLRHSIVNDGNYLWDKPVAADEWRYGLQFEDDGRSATVLFNDDFTVLGRLNRRGDDLRVVDCTPMAETLRTYFAGIEAFEPEGETAKPAVSNESQAASNPVD